MILADVCVRRPVFATMLVGGARGGRLVFLQQPDPGIDAQGRNAGGDGDNHPAPAPDRKRLKPR